MVTGEADREGVEPRKARVGEGRWLRSVSRQQDLAR